MYLLFSSYSYSCNNFLADTSRGEIDRHIRRENKYLLLCSRSNATHTNTPPQSDLFLTSSALSKLFLRRAKRLPQQSKTSLVRLKTPRRWDFKWLERAGKSGQGSRQRLGGLRHLLLFLFIFAFSSCDYCGVIFQRECI